MPTYEYRCAGCGHKWDEFQSIKAAPSRKCPGCGKLKAERVISGGGGVIFRGSGFYQTDYRSESWKKGEEAAKKASESGSSGSSSSDSGSSSAADKGSKAKKAGE